MNLPSSSARNESASRDEGATLVELAIGLVLTSIVVIVAYGVYSNTRGVLKEWSARRRVEATALTLERRLAEDLRSTATTDSTANGYRLTGPDAVVNYQAQHDQLYRNGLLASGDTSTHATLLIRPLPSSDQRQAPRFEAFLRLVYRRDTLRAHLSIASRVIAPAWQEDSPQP